MRDTTLCLLVKKGEILLAMKKRGFGVGKWNGVGGKLEPGETIEKALVREAKEEIGVDVKENALEKVGEIKFFFGHKPDWNQCVHIFFVKTWEGDPVESEEMLPKWYPHEDIPFDNMWPDDTYWLPKVLEGKRVQGEFYFNEDGQSFDKYDLREI